MKYFVVAATARTAADLSGVHHNTEVRFFYKLRENIALKQHESSRQFLWEIEPDESYFDERRKGERGKG
jgi:transposase